ncbi:MAG: FAD:protein FMN transferase, partial [Lachnospiraceae bacterium]|nr:FAD:protein FMN transferase [Lachnospiraceae bacterium]
MKRFILCFIFLFFALTTSSCASVTKEPISKSSIFFDTIISIQIYDSSDTKLLDGCFKICETYEQKLSRTIETSEISKINNASGMPVEVSNETIDVIKKGLYYSELSNGKFDITVAP